MKQFMNKCRKILSEICVQFPCIHLDKIIYSKVNFKTISAQYFIYICVRNNISEQYFMYMCQAQNTCTIFRVYVPGTNICTILHVL